MTTVDNHYIKSRVLKINVGFVLAEGPGFSRTMELDVPQRLRVSDDLMLERLSGDIRLTRTSEGVLLQGEMECALSDTCSRCLDRVEVAFPFQIEELFAVDPDRGTADFIISEDANLDLAPLVREEVFIAMPKQVFCREDCQGLCPTCGQNRNESMCDCEPDDIDPRWAALSQLHKQLSDEHD